ncbi:MAG: hypothetical protein WBS54_13505 [Acidobacteriota bacterium]
MWGDRPRVAHWLLPGLITLFVALFLILQVSPRVNRVTEDESMVVYDAHRLVQGEVPYRDFFSMWTPGALYPLSGGPWGWWRRPETGTRYLQVLLVLAETLALASLLREKRPWNLLLAAVLPLVLFPMAPFMGNHWMAVLLYGASIMAALALMKAPQNRWGWLGLGALAGTTGCFMQTEGLLAAVLMLFTVLGASGTVREAAARGGWAVAGVVLAFALWIGPLLLLGAGRAFVEDALLWPLANYRKPGNLVDRAFLSDLPGRLEALWAPGTGTGHLFWFVTAAAGTLLYLVILAALAAAAAFSLYTLAAVVFRRRSMSPPLTTASILTLAGLGMYAHVNPTWVHVIYAATPVFLLWAIVLSGAGSAALRRTGGGILLLVLACGVLFFTRGYWGTRHHAWEFFDVDRVDREAPLIRSLRAMPFMHKGDTIVVLPAGGSDYLYAFPAAIGYTQLFVLQQGQYTRADHRRAAQEIEARRPKLIVIDRINEGDLLAPSDPLSGVVRRNYVPWSQTPAVTLYLRRDLVPPHPVSQSPTSTGAKR